MYYYHATYRSLIESIQEKGLGGNVAWFHWDISRAPHVDHPLVCLTSDPDIAESYAETNDRVPENEEIVIFRVSCEKLDSELLHEDSNVLDTRGECFEYHSIIPFEWLEELS